MKGAEQLDRDGLVVAEDLLSEREIETFRSELEPYFGAESWGRNDLEGTRTERVYALLVKCPSVAALVEPPASSRS